MLFVNHYNQRLHQKNLYHLNQSFLLQQEKLLLITYRTSEGEDLNRDLSKRINNIRKLLDA